MMVDLVAAVLVTICGLVVGSFLNVCIYRLPRAESIAWPGSHCPICRAPVRAYDNLPVVSYVILRGRCRTCGQAISMTYPIVELLTAGLFLGAFEWYPSPLVFQRILFGCALIVLFFVDLEHHRLPNEITLPGIVAGFAFSVFMPPGWRDSLLGIVIGGGSLWLLGTVWFLLRHEEGMGFGDVKMLAMIGAFLGWKLMLATLLVSTILGSAIGLGLITARRGDLKTALPFGCFLAIGAAVASVVGDRALDWYLSFYR
jgi:leader peptidase (prepilin peptidase)/N-methyltransferase